MKLRMPSKRLAVRLNRFISISWSKQSREVKSGSGYASQNDLRLHFGLGKAKIVDRLEIEWASGNQQIMEQVKANQFLTVIEEE